jgi:hypothetical protein
MSARHIHKRKQGGGDVVGCGLRLVSRVELSPESGGLKLQDHDFAYIFSLRNAGAVWPSRR